jgi:exodeoxyribonuclease V gamma subunit
VEATACDLTVVGRIDSISGKRLVTYRFGRLGARERIVAWIRHLLLNCKKGKNTPRETVLIGVAPGGGRGKQKTITPKAVRYRTVDNPRRILTDIVKAFVAGLYTPYPFAPNASWTYAERKLIKEDDHPTASARAERIWEGSDFSMGEREDPYYAMVWRDRSVVDDEAFAVAAEAFWKPLIEHEEDA